MDNSLSYSVLNYLKRLKNQAKMEYDRIVSVTPFKGKVGPDGIKVNVKTQLRKELLDGLGNSGLRDQVTDFPGYMLGLPEKSVTEAHPLRNPFDIPRARLLDQLVRMRANLVGRGRGAGSQTQTVDSDTRHTLPIAQMGNYQDYLKKQPLPLRELESQPVRQHMFGNPFKINKNLMMGADEVSGIGAIDEVQLVGVAGPAATAAGRGVKRTAEALQQPGPPKRRKGALPKDFQFVSPRSSPARSSPPSSPSPLEAAPPPQATPPPVVAPRPGLANGVLVPGQGTVYPGGKMAAFRSQCEVVDMEPEPPLVIMEEVKMLELPEEDEEEELIQVDDDDDYVDDHEPEVKPLNNIKKNPVSPYDCLPYDSSPSMTPPDSPRDCPSPPLYSDTKLELNGGKNGVYEVLELVEPEELSPPSPVMVKPEKMEKLGNLTAEELRSIRLRNNNMRQLIYKEVKKPGRQHRTLWEMLAKLHGPPWIRRQFILEVRQEAVR